MIEIKKTKNYKKLKQLTDRITQLESIIALLPGHVYWFDRHHTVQGCNNNQAVFAKNGIGSILGKSHYDMIWKQQAQTFEALNRKIMEEGTPYIGEEKVKLPEGEQIYLSHKVPIRDDNNEVSGLLGISLDITNLKRIERDLQVAKEKAELADQIKTEFLRNMEHDIRTPLCGIMNVVMYLESLEEDAKKKEFLSDIHIATNELLNYLENIVEFSQINLGTVPFILREFDLKQVLQGILNLESAAAKDKRLELDLTYPDDVPCHVIGDRFRLHRLLLNLVNNAIKFTEKGSVKIHVSIVSRSKNHVLIKIQVIDTGIGIAVDYHDVIFDKFTRCNPANAGIYKGNGLGLWIVKHFIKDLKGKILLESELNKGSTLTCLLPFKIRE